jgi:hypothetical protein
MKLFFSIVTFLALITTLIAITGKADCHDIALYFLCYIVNQLALIHIYVKGSD